MFYAITIKDGIITGRHESATPITEKTFDRNPSLAGQEVIEIAYSDEYCAGHFLGEYADHKLRPLIDRIIDGFAPVPPGQELIDGELVEVSAPAEKAPPSLKETLETEKQATRVMFRALATSGVIAEKDVVENRAMFEEWGSRIGHDALPGEYLVYQDRLFRVQTKHTVMDIYPPGIPTAALYAEVNMPGQVKAWEQGSYAKDVQVTHGGKTWLSMVDNNVWEPGAPGVHETIWKEVKE